MPYQDPPPPLGPPASNWQPNYPPPYGQPSDTPKQPGRSRPPSWVWILVGFGLVAVVVVGFASLQEDVDEGSTNLVVQISLIEPPDEIGYYDRIESRNPEILTFFTPAELIELGLRSCALRHGSLTGKLADGSWPPSPRDALIEEIDDSYRLPPDVRTWRVAGVVSNAADGSLCETTYLGGG